MAIEEEFSIEIPDKEADAIHSGKSSRQYSITVADDVQWTKRSHILPPNRMRIDWISMDGCRRGQEQINHCTSSSPPEMACNCTINTKY